MTRIGTSQISAYEKRSSEIPMPLEGRSSWTPGGAGWFATLSTWQPLRSTRRPTTSNITRESEMTETK